MFKSLATEDNVLERSDAIELERTVSRCHDGGTQARNFVTPLTRNTNVTGTDALVATEG